MDLSEEIKTILLKPAKNWTAEEGAKIWKLMQANGKETVKQALEELRSAAAINDMDQ